ncbi:hypothetical protein EYUKI_28 [Bacillus phage Eyuki]|uniref:Uncharacterized protein n=1 Tax=Bacillus phage Eyuki TaxID=1690431 RepID=A0A0K2FL88_9CAUD|nr:hypothetical protein QLX47_gp028 [Bacillus phage Eyuki]ALA46586.1 hypothetical protein EYUKI_28 [Bacillus phage Eyuki]ASR79239.1 hypothetical protein ZAINNY_26 [Bacillus phage Zainny]
MILLGQVFFVVFACFGWYAISCTVAFLFMYLMNALQGMGSTVIEDNDIAVGGFIVWILSAVILCFTI